MMDERLDLETSRRERPTSIRWQMVFILMAFTGINHFHRLSLPAVINAVMADCGFNEKQMGWLASSFLAGYVLCMIPGGWLADRRGARFALALSGFGTGIAVIATGCLAIGTNYGLASAALFGALLAVRFLMGMLTSPLFPAAGRIVSAWIPFQTRAWANGLVLGATTIGVAAAPIVFGALSDVVGWRGACVIMGCITLGLTLVWCQRGRNRPSEHPSVNQAELEFIGDAPETIIRPSMEGFLPLITNPSLLLLTLNYAAVGYYEYTLFYWMKYYFSDVMHYEEQTARYFTSIVSFAMVFAMPLGGILSDRMVRRWGYRIGRSGVPIFGMLASAVLLFAATRATDKIAVVSLFFLAHAAIGLCEAPTWVAGLEIGGRNCGTSGAIVNTGGNFGGLLAPVVTAYVGEQYGWNAGFALASLACLAGVGMWLGIRLEHPEANTLAEHSTEPGADSAEA